MTSSAAELNAATAVLEAEDDSQFSQKRDVNTASDRCLGAIFETCETRKSALDQSVIPLDEDGEAELIASSALIGAMFPDGKPYDDLSAAVCKSRKRNGTKPAEPKVEQNTEVAAD